MFAHTVKEFETAILWRRGAIVKLVPAGRYRFLPFSGKRLDRFDMRSVPLKINGQEIILADRTSLKINIAGTYKLADPILRIKTVSNLNLDDYMNQLVQLTLRGILAEATLESLFEEKLALSKAFKGALAAAFMGIGIELTEAGIKDIILPSDLRSTYVEAAAAKTRSKTQLENARGQSAALRNLANSASLLEQHPQLIQLMSIQKTDKAAQSNVNLHFNDKK